MQQSDTRNSPPPHAPLFQLVHGALHAQILCVAAQLGVVERLGQDGPITAKELAPKLGVDALILERILRALVSMNVCDEIDGRRSELNETVRTGEGGTKRVLGMEGPADRLVV